MSEERAKVCGADINDMSKDTVSEGRGVWIDWVRDEDRWSANEEKYEVRDARVFIDNGVLIEAQDIEDMSSEGKEV